MSWAPVDLVADSDLLAYESQILTQFNVFNWTTRRQKALEDWLFPLLEARGFVPERLRTRFEPAAIVGDTAAASSDLTSAGNTSEGLDVAAILADPADSIYIGSRNPFRGLSLRMLDQVNTGTGALAVSYWADGWTTLAIADGTKAAGVSLVKGGAITWTMPELWVPRTLSPITDPIYWVRLRADAVMVGPKVGPLLVIRRSRLCAPVTFRTLSLIFREAPTSQDGPWDAKAVYYEQEAEQSWLRVADHIGGEFDTDGSDAISSDETEQTADAVSGGWTMERA
jgi:hypothetical protein